MSNMENLGQQLSEKERQDAVYRDAVSSMSAAKVKQTASGYAVMAAAANYGEGAKGVGTFGKVSHAAKLFCIGFAFLLPSLLIWRVVL